MFRANNSVLGETGPLHRITLEGTDCVIVPENGTPWSYAVPSVCRHVEVLGNGCQEGRLFGKTIKKENLSLELKYKQVSWAKEEGGEIILQQWKQREQNFEGIGTHDGLGAW